MRVLFSMKAALKINFLFLYKLTQCIVKLINFYIPEYWEKFLGATLREAVQLSSKQSRNWKLPRSDLRSCHRPKYFGL